jgi:hypothetical protein
MELSFILWALPNSSGSFAKMAAIPLGLVAREQLPS